MTAASLAVVLAALGAPSQSADSALQASLDSSHAALAAPGAGAAVIFRDGRAWSGVSGIAATGVALDSETVFQLASVTKTYTAALALLLVEAGTLHLDDPLSTWYPDFVNASRITIRQLLNHTSGLHDPMQESDFVGAVLADPARTWAPEDLFARMKDPYFEPGAGWHYTNTGYHLLGRILEQVTGESIAALVRTRLIERIGLGRTYFGAVDSVPAPTAHAFIDIDDDGTPEDVSLFMSNTGFMTSAGAAGAILASASDAARYAEALHTGQLLSAQSYDAMTSWVDRPDGNRYGLGLLRVELDGTVLYGHRGNSAGFSAAVWHAPERGLTLAVLTNAHAVAVTPIVRALLSAVDATENKEPQ
jgi:D-alanyl-D-alanine carboxypeptidase